MLSNDEESRVLPSGANETVLTQSVCPVKVFKLFPVSISQSLIVLSADAEAKVLPSGENETDWILAVCPINVFSSAQVLASQNFILETPE